MRINNAFFFANEIIFGNEVKITDEYIGPDTRIVPSQRVLFYKYFLKSFLNPREILYN